MLARAHGSVRSGHLDLGRLHRRRAQRDRYTYDAENHLTASHDASGLTGPQQTFIDTQSAYDDLGRLTRTDLKKQADPNWTFSVYGYDANSNLTGEDLNGLETSPSGGTVVKDGNVVTLDYDQANWLIDLYDTGNATSGTNNSPQQSVLEQFTPTGKEARREVDKVVGGGFTLQQLTTWSYYANDKLQSMTTTGAGQSQPLEQHTVGYLDPGGIYVDGNRTTDSFTLKPGTAASGACYPTACNASYTYDPRDRLTSQDDGRGTVTTYDLDPSGNIQDEKVNGNLTKQYTYQGSLLQQVTAGGVVSKYWYDDVGRLHCVTTVAGSAGDCSTAASGASSNLLADYEYDYMDRLQSYQAYGSGNRTDYATYAYDALNRLATETELHPNFNGGDTRSTQYSYLGLGGQLTREQQSNSTGLLDTRDYSYDAYGNRLSQTVTGSTLPGVPNGTSTYGYDVHGSVSQLIDANGNSQASYGYKAYGQTDGGLTQGDPDPLNPVSPFRYSAKHMDTGSSTLDMGARRFGPDVSRFLTPDLFFGALSNLSLSLDPITQNRYGLAGGNPISFREWDGHAVLADGGGGAATTPTTATPPVPADRCGGCTDSRGAPAVSRMAGTGSTNGQSSSQTNACKVNAFGHQFQAPCPRLPMLNTSDGGSNRQDDGGTKACPGQSIGLPLFGVSYCGSASAVATPRPGQGSRNVDPKTGALAALAAACVVLCPSLASNLDDANRRRHDDSRNERNIRGGDELQDRLSGEPEQGGSGLPPKGNPRLWKIVAFVSAAALALAGGDLEGYPRPAPTPTPTPTPSPSPSPCGAAPPAVCPSPPPTPSVAEGPG
jgi:RHS repeat-associated protein